MLAKRIPTILPKLTFDEALEITKIHSIAGVLKDDSPLITTRPFRSPHHTISPISLIGGGKIPKPGEISLAHNGVLFLDELTEFNKTTLEVLRQPLEDGTVTISRVNSSLTYPSNFMFVASMNPCPCGYYGSNIKDCNCSAIQIARYLGKISGPLLDRIDIHIEVSTVNYSKLQGQTTLETSKDIRKRIDIAKRTQIERYKNYNIFSNAAIPQKLIDEFCKLDYKGKTLLENAFSSLNLSARAYSKILKVARTIADLDGKENILYYHLSEAIQHRSLDRKYWSNN